MIRRTSSGRDRFYRIRTALALNIFHYAAPLVVRMQWAMWYTHGQEFDINDSIGDMKKADCNRPFLISKPRNALGEVSRPHLTI